MSGPAINPDFVDAIALPRLVWLRPNLIGSAFPLMKLLPDHPHDGDGPWAFFRWGRRSYAGVMDPPGTGLRLVPA